MEVCARVLVIFIFLVMVNAAPNYDKLTIRIVHTNDMHSRFEETSRFSGPCRTIEASKGKCYGGFARLATLIREARRKGLENDLPTFFLNAGDTYQGTGLFLRYHWQIVAKFLNILKPDAASLGNHEFDDGVKGLVPFLNNVTFPVVTANIDLSNEPSMQHTTSLKPSVILTAKGRKIGVIGFLTPETKHLSRTDNVTFLDEVESIKNEAKNLTSQGCNIIIALGHSGYQTDLKIAEKVEEVDLVIGGHTNTFLYNGPEPDEEKPEGMYPTVVKQASGKKVYVVQAYAYTKYLGDLSIDFNEQGDITRIEGSPILVDSSIPKAEDVERELGLMLQGMQDHALSVVASTRVTLKGDEKICRMEECNLGNLVTDALVFYNARRYKGEYQWTDAPIAIYSGGGIRSSITPFNDNQVLKDDINTAFPFSTLTYKVNMTGEKLTKVLEHSVWDRIDATNVKHGGAFLQFSGVQITYNISEPVGSRVVSVKLRCGQCLTPIYENLNFTKMYTLIVPEFLYGGGDNYDMMKGLPFINLNANISEIVTEYMNLTSPILTGLENRLTVIWNEDSNNQPNSAFSFVHQFPTLIILVSIICSIHSNFL